MNILVINTGSSSIKYQLFRMPSQDPACSGLVERIGLGDSIITHKIYREGQEAEIRETLEIKDHEAGLREVNRLLTDKAIGVIGDPAEIEAVGHRVVHGGEDFAATTVITAEVKEKIRELFSLAPLHNPANYLGIQVAEKIFSAATQVAVFDTAFHQRMPEKAFRYAIPKKLYTVQKIRAYGFHGTSHKYVSRKAMDYIGKEDAKLITIHLGNGCSMAAVDAGRSVDTSMGFGPLSGLVMGTRSGDIDGSVIFHMLNEQGHSPAEVGEILNKQSGLKGLGGSSDMRDITAAVESGDSDARMALDIYCYRIKKYIGAYTAVLNGLDALVFTAGVGENAALVRELACNGLEYLGISLDKEKNQARSRDIRDISNESSRVKILVIPTNEELEIVNQCWELLQPRH